MCRLLMLLFGLLDILDIVPVIKFVPPNAKKILEESMDSKISNFTYFKKDLAPAGPITSFVRYCVELPHRVHIIHCILYEEL